MNAASATKSNKCHLETHASRSTRNALSVTLKKRNMPWGEIEENKEKRWTLNFYFSLSSRFIFCVKHRRCHREAFIVAAAHRKPRVWLWRAWHWTCSQTVEEETDTYQVKEQKPAKQHMTFYLNSGVALNIWRPFKTLQFFSHFATLKWEKKKNSATN